MRKTILMFAVCFIAIILFCSCMKKGSVTEDNNSSSNSLSNSSSISVNPPSSSESITEKVFDIKPIDFQYSKAIISNGFDISEEDFLQLDTAQISELEILLQKDKWEIADNLPEKDYVSFVILEDKNSNIAFLNKYQNKALIVTKYAADSNQGVNYFAPIEIIEKVTNYITSIKS